MDENLKEKANEKELLDFKCFYINFRAMKMKKTGRELKTSEQLTEERIDTNNYAIKENGCPGWMVI